MGDWIKKRLRMYSVLVIVLLTGLLGFVFLFSMKYQRINVDENKVRIEVNSLLYQLEQREASSKTSSANGAKELQSELQCSDQQFSMDYCIFNLDGTVMESTVSRYPVGKKVDLHTIGAIDSYVVPVQTSTGTQLVLIDCSGYEKGLVAGQVAKNMILPVLLYVIAVIVIIKRVHLEQKEILAPIDELHISTKSILAGDMEVPVRYDYDGEIGTLCHDFELMREELVDSYAREVQSKEKERAMYASISHDLKTPLATITGYIEEILYGVAQTPEDVNDYAKRMLNKAVVLNKLIDDILEHSKSQLNQLSIQKKEVYAKEFFEPLLRGYQADVTQKKCKLTYELPENVLIDIDTSRITEVIQNLIDNALKYGSEHPEIQVSFEMMTEPSQQMIIHVKDNGRGIEAADLPFIFDMFYRGNKARTCDIPGSGLGLNIAKYIVEQHGGQIECDSIAGVGTTISFSLPVD